MVRSLFHIDLNLSQEYAPLINELIQTSVVFMVVHVLQALQDPTVDLLNEGFLQALVFVLIGFTFYYLIWKKLVRFVYDDNVEEGFRGTLRLFNK